MRPTEAVCDKSVGEILLMVFEFGLASELTAKGLTNTFNVLNALFPRPILPNSKYLIDKIFNPQNDVEYHAVCDNCGAYAGKFGTVEQSTCSVCNFEINLQDKSKQNFFVLIDPKPQISDLVTMFDDHYNYVINERTSESGYITDVYDGNEYKKLVRSLPEERKTNYLTTVFNTDGAQKFKRSKSSVWPLYLMINELPAQEHLDKLVTCGLWYRNKKPDMGIFIDTFVDFFNRVQAEGVSCVVKNENRVIYPYILECCVDTVARAPIQGIIQFNGYHGCAWCVQEGFYYCRCVRYPTDQDTTPRDDEETADCMKTLPEASLKQRKKILETTGVKDPSPLINLRPQFSSVRGFNTEYMHGVLEGVVPQITDYHLNTLSENEILELDEKMKKITAPHQLAQLTRPLSKRDDYTAKEWENYALYYSIPILSTFLSHKKLKHWTLLVESLYTLLQRKIHIDEVNAADEKLAKFVEECQVLYGMDSMTFNVHILLHLSETVVNWGPLWCQSTFPFESANYLILKAIKCAKGVTSQLVRHVNFQHYKMLLKEKVFGSACVMVKMFCKESLHNRCIVTQKLKNITYFGRGDTVSEDIINRFNLSKDTSCSFEKIVKDACLYESASREKSRSNNSFVQLSNGIFVNIIQFVLDVDTEQELTLCREVKTRNVRQVTWKKLQQVIGIEKDIMVVRTEDIKTIAILIKTDDVQYICPIVNLLHY